MAWPTSTAQHVKTSAECAVPGQSARSPAALGKRLVKIRPWVQTGFLAIWLAPVGRWLHGIPGCVFHCHSCPFSALACPIGVAANYAALFPAAFEIPYLLIGVLLLVGAIAGSLVCGWACPFGFLQDLLGKITPTKLQIPGWLGYGRYFVLIAMVVLLPMILGYRGTAYDEQTISICRLCPAGALEAGLPYSISSIYSGGGWLMSWWKTAILLVFFGSALAIHRPWCRIFCPLGGLLALFNRWSLFHLKYNSQACIECNLCRSRCKMGVKVDQKVNVPGCIRCLECTTCGALSPSFALPQEQSASLEQAR
jgi:ferredoxin-type protein NapH